MITWSKDGIFKPKVLEVEPNEREHCIIEEDFANNKLQLAAQDEYDALIRTTDRR